MILAGFRLGTDPDRVRVRGRRAIGWDGLGCTGMQHMDPGEFRRLMKLRFGLLVNEREARTAAAQFVSAGSTKGVRGRETDTGLPRTLDVAEKDLLDDDDPSSADGVVVRPW